MNSGRIMNLLVTIPAESRRVHIGKDIIRILGSPDYILRFAEKRSKIHSDYAVCCGSPYVISGSG